MIICLPYAHKFYDMSFVSLRCEEIYVNEIKESFD